MAVDAPTTDCEFDHRVERFESSWRSGNLPAIGDYLSGERNQELNETERKELLEELVMIDLEYRWRQAAANSADPSSTVWPADVTAQDLPRRPRLDDYLRHFPELGPLKKLSTELIASEYRVRQRWGDRPSHEEFFEGIGRRDRKLVHALKRVDARLPQSRQTPGLRIRCPHCHDSIELGEADPGGQIACPSCDRGFSLVDQAHGNRRLGTGDRIGAFKLVEQLGSGSFGTVWKAHHIELDRLVAVKLPHQGLFDTTQREQFLREARTAAQLNHPSIVPVYEVGRDADRLFIVTELVAGVNLAEWLAARLPTPREAADVCRKIADALEHAHQHGVVHRDLKPSNIMLDEGGEPRLMDFGLAKRAAGEVTMTVEGKLLGTPAYMSPEQARGSAHAADRRSDVYALGVILFELLTGERPFGGSTEMLLERIVSEDAVSPRLLSGSVPRDLETICLKCLEKDPDQRFQSAAELRDDLQRFVHGKPVHARPITRADRAWRWCKRNRAVAALGAAAAMLLLFLAVAGPLVAVSRARLAAREAEAREETRRQLYFSDMNVAVQASEEGDMRRVGELLDRHRPRGALRDLRGLEWYYLWRLYQRSENVPTLPHELPVTLVAFSPDGRTLASASGQVGDRFEITLWDTLSRSKRGSLPLDERDISAGAFSPDVQTIALGYSDGAIRLESIQGFAADVVLPVQHEGEILSLAFSPDGTKLASRSQEKVVVWDIGTREPEWKLPTDEVPANAPPTWFKPMAFSPTSEILAWGTTDGTIKLCDAATGAEQASLEHHVGTILSVAFSPNGQFLASASGWGNTVLLWDVASHQVLHRMQKHQGFILSVAFSADGSMLASAGQDNTVRLWDVAEGKELHVLHGHTGGVTTLAFSPTDGTLASGGEGYSVRLWHLAHQTEQDLLEAHSGIVRGTAFSPDNHILASASLDRTIQLWDVATGKIQRTFQDSEQVWSVAYAAGGKTLASGSGERNSGSRPGRVKLRDAATGRLLRQSSVATAPVQSISYDAKGGETMAIGTADGKVLLLDAATLELRRELGQHASRVYCVEFSPDGKTLASAGQDNVVKLWDVDSGRHRDLQGHMGLVMSVAFSPDGETLASGSRDRTVRFWDVRDGRDVATLTGHTAWVTSVAFSMDGRTLVSGDGLGTIKLWDVATRQRRVNLHVHTGVFCARFSADDKILATSSGPKVRLWRRATEEEVLAAD